MAFKWKRKLGRKKKAWHKKKKVYRKPQMTMYKVPKMKTIGLKREQWLDINFAAPGGHAWTVDGRVHADVRDETPVFNMKINTLFEEGDPEFSRVTWQPVFTFAQLPDLSDVSGMFRLFKINKISITLYPMRNSNPILDTGVAVVPQQGLGVGQYVRSQIAPNLLVTTLYAKSGLDNRIGMGTFSLAQVQNKKTKLYNLGIGNRKLGWYFKPYVQSLTMKNSASLGTSLANGYLTGDPPTQIPHGDINIADCFSYTVRKPGYQDIEEGKHTEHFGPMLSFRSVDGSNLAAGTEAANNMKFRACIKYYFSLKGTH